MSNNSSFSKINNLGSCGRSPQQIVGGLRPQMICGWPRGPAKVCRPRNEAAVKRIYTFKTLIKEKIYT